MRYRIGSFAASKSANSHPPTDFIANSPSFCIGSNGLSLSAAVFPLTTVMDWKIWQGSTATRAAGRPLCFGDVVCGDGRGRRPEIDLLPTRLRRRRLCKSLHPTTVNG